MKYLVPDEKIKYFAFINLGVGKWNIWYVLLFFVLSLFFWSLTGFSGFFATGQADLN